MECPFVPNTFSIPEDHFGRTLFAGLAKHPSTLAMVRFGLCRIYASVAASVTALVFVDFGPAVRKAVGSTPATDRTIFIEI